MSAYDLFDHQKQALMRLVEASKECGITNFIYISHNQGALVAFVDRETRKRKDANIVSDDLRLLEKEGLVFLHFDEKGRVAGGGLKASAYEAVDNNFVRPEPAATASAVYQNFYAPVGAVNAGHGKIEIERQNVGISSLEVASIIAELRAFVPSLPAPSAAEAGEVLDDLESELRAPIPKQSKVKSFLLSLWTVANGAADFGIKLAALATAYGIDPTSLHLPH